MEVRQESLRAIPRIAELREKAGLTQLELSRRLGVTETTIQNWEKGRAGLEQIERLIKLCEALACDIKDLIEYVSDATNKVPKLEPTGRLGTMREKLGTDKLPHTASDETTSASQRR